MALSLTSGSKLSEKLTAASFQELTALILRSEDPVGSSELVASLFELLVGGPGSGKEVGLIKEPNLLLLIFNLLPHCTEPLQVEIWSRLLDVLGHSLSNLEVTRPFRLFDRCLECLRRVRNEKVANLQVKVLEVVGCYHVSLVELQRLLSYLYTSRNEDWAPYSTILLGALSSMASSIQPEVFFSFSGAPGAAFTLPPFSKWPTTSGFSLNLWLRLEKSSCSGSSPTVYWFRTGRPDVGYSAHLMKGETLVIETVGRTKKPQTHRLDFPFKPRLWYMLTVSYVFGRLRSCQMNCYVNGKMALHVGSLVLPPSDDVIFDKCFLGSSPTSSRENVFCGQMSAIYLIKEALGKEVVQALFKLGPGYKSQFNFDAEVDVSLTAEEKKVLFDGRLSSSVIFSYNAKAVDGQLCLDASPNDNSGYFAHSPHATLLEGVSPVKTTTCHNILHSLGGLQVLMPLLSQLDTPQSSSRVDYSLCVRLMSLVFDMIGQSHIFLLQSVQAGTMELLAYLLSLLSWQHLSLELVSCLFTFAKSLLAAPSGIRLFSQVVEHLLFNPSLWVKADKNVQVQLYSRLATEFSIEPLGGSDLYLRSLVDTSYILFFLREFYSLEEEVEEENVAMHECVRPYLLLIIKEYLTKGRGIHREDMKALLDYLCSVPSERNLHDVLNLLLGIVYEDCHHPGNIVKLFIDEGGVNTAAKLLACSSEELTLNSLKLIAIVLHHLPTKECEHLVVTVELLAIIREKLLSAGQPVTIAMFNTLYEVLIDCPTRKIIDSHYAVLDPAHLIKQPRMLAVMVELVCSLHTSHENWEDGDTVMRIQLFSYVLSLCSQDNRNCQALLRLQHWQNWFLVLADQKSAQESDRDSLLEMVFRLFNLMLLYSFKEELDGWRLWAEIAAAFHAYTVSQTESSLVLDESESPNVPSENHQVLDSQEENAEPEDDDNHLESAESSSVSLTDSVGGDSADHNKRPSVSLSRGLSSGDGNPSSPFFIPKNPFLDLVGKVPKFRWTSFHLDLLEDLLISLHELLHKKKGTGGGKGHHSFLSDLVGDGGDRILTSNAIHLVGLTADSIVVLNGGLRHLLAHSSDHAANRKRSSVRRVEVAGSVEVKNILRLLMKLAEMLVLDGTFKLSALEAKLRMEAGGGARQGLRLVLASASLRTIEKTESETSTGHCYYKDKASAQSLLQDSKVTLQELGLKDAALMKYFETSYEQKLLHLKKSQQLLSTVAISHLRALVLRDKDNKVLFQQIVTPVLYYLSVMCIAKYSSILSHKERSKDSCHQEANGAVTTPTNSSTGANGDPVRKGEEPQEEATPQSPRMSPPSVDVSEQVTTSMKLVGPFLCELLLEHKVVLTKVLVAADNRPLLSDTVLKLAESGSILEITMLLCSQEWQKSLQKIGGRIFSELIHEGKKISRYCENYLRNMASTMLANLEKTVNIQEEKFTSFEEGLTLFLTDIIRTANNEHKLKKADIIRHTVSAKELWRKISSVVNETGLFDSTPLKDEKFVRLDLKSNSLSQRLQFVANPTGCTHEEAVRLTANVPEDEMPEFEKMENSHFVVPRSVLERRTSEVESSEKLLESLVTFPGLEEGPVAQLHSVQCLRVVLALAVPGTLVLTKATIAFTADDTWSDYEKAACLESYCALNGRQLLSDISAVLSRRYLHQNKALELFFTDRTSAFFVFESSREAGEMVQRLPKVGLGPHFDLPLARSVSLAPPQQLFKKSSMTARWERREITNFEYLMYLNILAGRTYSDLNQYPVFPWILKNYNSSTCDLSDPNNFRDLTKPVGALNPARLHKFEERYSCFEEDSMPPFYYGTHYSTMGAVLHWLVRVEPFSTLHINFHDGFFDQSPRIFHSLSASWENSTQDTSDVNELVPEFYYLPEMFENKNKFNFGHVGVTGEGELIDDIKLPPWASSVHEFVHKHREALESEYVSQHLHHWIDLIFGYKQRGAAAEDACNVFYYLTYTGCVDLEAVTDPLLRKGLEDQIRHFGQTPAQLLLEPHPPRMSLSSVPAPLPVQGLHPRDPAILGELQVTPDVPIALIQLSIARADLLVVSCNQLYTVNKWLVSPGAAKDRSPVVTIEPDKQILSGLRTRLGDPLDQSVTSPSACFTTTPSCSIIFVAGFWDNSFKCFDTNSGAMVQSVFGHRRIISCVDFSAEEGLHGHGGEGLIATGSHDATVLLWRWSGRLQRVVGSHYQDDALAPLSVCTGHKHPVLCISACSSLGIVVSGAKHGTCLVHSLCGELLLNLAPGPSLLNPHLVKVTRTGHLVLHYADQSGCLVTFSCNGTLLSKHPLEGPALALAVSEDGRFLVSGGFDCTLRIFSVYSLELLYSHLPFTSRIRSLHMSRDQRYVFVGLASGSIVALSTHVWMADSNN